MGVVRERFGRKRRFTADEYEALLAQFNASVRPEDAALND